MYCLDEDYLAETSNYFPIAHVQRLVKTFSCCNHKDKSLCRSIESKTGKQKDKEYHCSFPETKREDWIDTELLMLSMNKKGNGRENNSTGFLRPKLKIGEIIILLFF